MRTVHAVDLFSGAGGISSGYLDACQSLALDPRLFAINHWDVAIATHQKNLHGFEHRCAGVQEVDPDEPFSGTPLDLLIAAPSCVWWSVARGGKPVLDQQRADPWEIPKWLARRKPPAFLMENVPEFQNWGPLHESGPRVGKPIKSRRGEIFAAFIAKIRALGYNVEWRVLCCADYGDPTTRRRLFILGHRDRPIKWPEPTHAHPKKAADLGRLPWASARDHVIDWSIPGESIFERVKARCRTCGRRSVVRETCCGRLMTKGKKPLASNTVARIWAGILKYGPELGPLIISLKGTDPQQLQRSAHPIALPLGTLHAGGTHFGLAEIVAGAFTLSQQSGGSPRDVGQPLQTVAAGGAIHFVEFMVPRYGERPGQDPRVHSVDAPAPTVPATAQHALVQAVVQVAHGDNPKGSGRGNGGRVRSVDEPLHAVTGSGRDLALIEAMIAKYYGTGIAKPVSAPVDAVTTKPRFGLVTFDPVHDASGDVFLDIRYRMLQPHENARAQSLGAFRFTGTKSDQNRQIGNSVPRKTAAALCRAQLS